MAFFTTYALYKQGTAQVVSWLAKTAASCGYEGSTPADAAAQKTKKTNNKNSKGKGKGKDKTQSQQAKYTVSVRELPELARTISKHFPQMADLQALPNILEVLNDVILKRKDWAKNFGLPDTSTVASDVRHTHFVAVLEEVYQILVGLRSTLQMSRGKTCIESCTISTSLSSDENVLNNLFDVLDIEESVDHDDSVTSPDHSPSPSKPPTVSYELDGEVDEEDVYFRVYCFFKDFIDVRNQLGQSWAEYLSGILDLPAAAVTTNVALEMLQRAESELIASLPKKLDLSNYERISGLLQLTVAIDRGVNWDYREKPGGVINMKLKDIADFTCLPVYGILSSFLPVLQESPLPVLKPGHFGEIDMTGQPLSWRAKFNQGKIVLLEVLPEFCVLEQIRHEIPVMDELSRGLVEMIRTKKIPIWLVLGCQIYLDIHHTARLRRGLTSCVALQSSIGMAHKELQATGLHVSTTLQNYFDFSKDMSIKNWPQKNDKNLQMIKQETDCWINKDIFADVFAKSRRRFFKGINVTMPDKRPYAFLSRQPILCGMLLFRLNMRLQEVGVLLVNAWGSLPSVMHLYNAVKHESLDFNFPSWDDVEAVIKIQGKERIFVGDYPTCPEDYMKRFDLVLGYSASMFAANRRKGGKTPQAQTPASKRGPRTTIVTSAIADIFRGQYCDSNIRPEVTFQRIEDLINASTQNKKAGTGKSHKPRALTTVSFLSSLQGYIQSDILALNIDYFALHIRCIDLLRNIYIKLDAEFLKFLGPQYLDVESQLAFLVGYIFAIATGTTKMAEALKVPGNDIGVRSALMTKVGYVVRELVQKEGDKELERIRKLCRGFDWLEDEDCEIECSHLSLLDLLRENTIMPST
jgi:hypothetical protein